jgi:hypothetical protein
MSKLSLGNISKGSKYELVRMVLYSTEGVGKTTFASQWPSPIFFDIEGGSTLLDVSRFEKSQLSKYEDVLEALSVLETEDHSFKTLVIDTVDALENLVQDFICRKHGKGGLEEFEYGRGHSFVGDEFKLLYSKIEKLQNQKQMDVLFLCHAQIKTFKNPSGPDYDTYLTKLNEKNIGSWLRERCNIVAFANFELIAKAENGSKSRAFSTDVRVIHFSTNRGFNAKSRFELPKKMLLDYRKFNELLSAQRDKKAVNVGELVLEVKAVLYKISEENRSKKVKGEKTLEQVVNEILDSGNISEIKKCLDRLNAMTEEVE